jgi:hypothetical protein
MPRRVRGPDRAENAVWPAGMPATISGVATTADTQKRTYPATFAMVAWLAVAGFGVMFAVLLLAIHPINGASNALLTNELPGATVIAAILVPFLQLALCRVSAGQSALIVVHPVRRYVFPWHQVTDVVVDRGGGLQIVLRDGRKFAVFGFGGSVIGMITGGIRARKARDGIKAVMTAADGSESSDNPVTSSSGVQWKMMLVIWAATISLSIGGWLLSPHRVLV